MKRLGIFMTLIAAGAIGCEEDSTGLGRSPTADAGPDLEVRAGAQVTLDGSGSSSPGGGITSFLWVQAAGPQVALEGADSAAATFTAPEESVRLQFTLLVTGSAGRTDEDDMFVEVLGASAPTADAGEDINALAGLTVTLDGSGSTDPEDDITSYQWTQTAGEIVPLDDPSAVSPSFTAPPFVGRLEFELRVADATGNEDMDSVQVFVDENQAPVADAGPDSTAERGSTVTLDGTASFDPDGSIVAYQWRVIAGENVEISGDDSDQASLVMPNAGGPLEVELTVTDDLGALGSDVVRILASGTPPSLDVTFPVAGGDFEDRVRETTVRGTAADPDGGAITAVEINGVLAEFEGPDSPWWSARVPIAPGSGLLTVVATDEAGEMTSTTVAFENQAPFSAPTKIVAHPDGMRLFVLDERSGLVELDRSTGDRRLVNDLSAEPFVNPSGVALDAAGDRAFISDQDANAVFEVELGTGNVRELSGPNMGSGPALETAIDLILDPGRDRLLVMAERFQVLVGIDLATGAREEVSGPNRGSGGLTLNVKDLALDAAGDRLFISNGFDIISVDLATGDAVMSPRHFTARQHEAALWDAARDRLILSAQTLRTMDVASGVQADLASDRFFTPAPDIIFDPTDAAFGLLVRADQVLRVNLGSGALTTAVGPKSVGSGADLTTPRTLIFDADRDALFALVGDALGDRSILSIDVNSGARTAIATGLLEGNMGPTAMAWDPVRDQFLVGSDENCRMYFVDRSSGAQTDVANRVCVAAIALEPGAPTAYFSFDGFIPDEGRTQAIHRIDLATGEDEELSGPDRGDGVPLLRAAPASLMIDPAGGGLLAFDGAVWSIEVPSGDRRRLTGVDGDLAFIDPRFGRGVAILAVRDQIEPYDLAAGQRLPAIPVPGPGATLAIDAPARRAYFGLARFFEPPAIATIDLPTGEWVISAR